MENFKLNKHGNFKPHSSGLMKLKRTGRGFMNLKSEEMINRIGSTPMPTPPLKKQEVVNYKKASLGNGLLKQNGESNIRALQSLKLRNKKLNNLSFEL